MDVWSGGRNFLIEGNLAQRIVNFFFIVQYGSMAGMRGDTQYIFEGERERFIMKYQIFIRIKYNMIFCGQ